MKGYAAADVVRARLPVLRRCADHVLRHTSTFPLAFYSFRSSYTRDSLRRPVARGTRKPHIGAWLARLDAAWPASWPPPTDRHPSAGVTGPSPSSGRGPVCTTLEPSNDAREFVYVLGADSALALRITTSRVADALILSEKCAPRTLPSALSCAVPACLTTGRPFSPSLGAELLLAPVFRSRAIQWLPASVIEPGVLSPLSVPVLISILSGALGPGGSLVTILWEAWLSRPRPRVSVASHLTKGPKPVSGCFCDTSTRLVVGCAGATCLAFSPCRPSPDREHLDFPPAHAAASP